jgi:uncharacterized membrane protein
MTCLARADVRCLLGARAQDEGWRPSITVKQILLGIQVLCAAVLAVTGCFLSVMELVTWNGHAHFMAQTGKQANKSVMAVSMKSDRSNWFGLVRMRFSFET